MFEAYRVRPVDEYPSRLLETLRSLSDLPDPTIVILTPGIYNAAYYEHSLLAQKMGIELVEAGDLAVTEGSVHMRATKGSQRVDVIYRQNLAEKRLGRLRAQLDFVDIDDCVTAGLHEFVDDFQSRLNRVGEAIFETFFAPHRVHSRLTLTEGQ